MDLSNKIKIKIPNIITLEDYRVLTLLYLPIIGNYSFMIYQTFYWLNQYKNNLNYEYSLKFLLDFLNIDINLFEQNKNKLEALNLLETLQNKQEIQKKIFLVKSPLTAFSFLQDPILSQFLLDTVGEDIYFFLERTFLYENQIDSKKYQNISKKFENIFNFKKINIKKEIQIYQNKKHNSNNNKFYDNFDFDVFIANLPERFQKPFLFEHHNINYLTKLSFVYGLTPEKMSSLYQKTFRQNYENEIDLNQLRIVLKRKYFQKDYQIKIVSHNNSQDEENKMIIYLQKTDPYRIIRNFSKNKYFALNLQDIVFKLIEQNNDIEKGIINSLIMYVCKIKSQEDTTFLSYNYFQTILNSWLNQGIVSTELAYNFLIEKNPKKFKSNKNNNNKIRPKWLEDMKKESNLNSKTKS
ncbi:putative replicative DNA helicase DnaB-like protein [Candidatus Phytoplasma oryzae]|uniref:Putative replicative DNA helicase DnaB-like protein n=1 Tax=Candidatus Phytoplasma oryzae TaxID=203274 RepID=A0A139JQ95_9MOLU|nr:DnaD domain protein [Candidatus Phytoplasma oryzae]KXT29056.1 putative replicative DNA helicase DnaB-like protein [Candidatus Phytoplasma oryzae]RAM57660.1 hypothetical protein DH96_02280 [Candidatus Phytoplasma oryzae]